MLLRASAQSQCTPREARQGPRFACEDALGPPIFPVHLHDLTRGRRVRALGAPGQPWRSWGATVSYQHLPVASPSSDALSGPVVQAVMSGHCATHAIDAGAWNLPENRRRAGSPCKWGADLAARGSGLSPLVPTPTPTRETSGRPPASGWGALPHRGPHCSPFPTRHRALRSAFLTSDLRGRKSLSPSSLWNPRGYPCITTVGGEPVSNAVRWFRERSAVTIGDELLRWLASLRWEVICQRADQTSHGEGDRKQQPCPSSNGASGQPGLGGLLENPRCREADHVCRLKRNGSVMFCPF